MKYHPDRNQGDKDSESKFKEIKKLYEVPAIPQNDAAMINMVMLPLNKVVLAVKAVAALAALDFKAISLVMCLAIFLVVVVVNNVLHAAPDLQYNTDLTL